MEVIQAEIEQWILIIQIIATSILTYRIITLAISAITDMEADNRGIKKQLIIYISAAILINIAPQIIVMIAGFIIK